jgi:hypothetical protein
VTDPERQTAHRALFERLVFQGVGCLKRAVISHG